MNNKSESLTRQVIETIIQLGALAFIVGWCYQILSPFVTPIVWGIIIAITIYPVFIKLSNKLGNSRKISSSILRLLLLAIILAPAFLLSGSLIDGARILKNAIQEGGSIILGAIGGFIARGFIGLFLGAVILSLGYKLFGMWIAEREAKSHEKAEQT
jgi:predicted PurR-regulated permease PerM